MARLKVWIGTALYRIGLLPRRVLFRWEMDWALGSKVRPYGDGVNYLCEGCGAQYGHTVWCEKDTSRKK